MGLEKEKNCNTRTLVLKFVRKRGALKSLGREEGNRKTGG